jgi:hypothetical protein
MCMNTSPRVHESVKLHNITESMTECRRPIDLNTSKLNDIHLTRTVAVEPGIRTILHPLHMVRFTLGSLCSPINTKWLDGSWRGETDAHLDSRLLTDEFH